MKRPVALALAIVISTAGITATPATAGLFDKLKKKAEDAVSDYAKDKAEEAVGIKDDSNSKDAATSSSSSSKTASTSSSGNVSPAHTASSASELYGQWRGSLSDLASNHVLSTASFEIFLSDGVNVARVSEAANRCIAELKESGKPGHYRATFYNGIETCGKSADLTISPDGAMLVTWTGVSDIADKALKGKLERQYSLHARKEWSSTLKERKANDIVGFYPGMTYAQAKAHWKADHDDLKREIRWVRDDGTSSIVNSFSMKENAKAGDSQLQEQINLGFESQTLDELKDIDAKKAGADAEDLRRADAHLMYVHRHLQFADRKGPTADTLKAALIKKYGKPSVDKVQAYNQMQWSYDKDDHLLSNAEGGVCDHWQRYSNQNLAPNYKKAQSARVPYITAHPDCGLTVKVQYKLFDGAVSYLDIVTYDQQRLMGDQWYGLGKFYAALLDDTKAKAKAMKSQAAPDL